MLEQLLVVENLRTRLSTDHGAFDAVAGVSFHLTPGETLGIVGESGCGKSLTALSIMGLIPDPPGRVVSGQIIFRGQNLLLHSERQMQHVRGKDIAMIFQEPMTALNPVFTIGEQLIEGIMLHEQVTRRQAKEKSVSLLGTVGIPAAEQRLRDYPHQLSGGMRQRVMIAMALSCQPALLIADEPTTALDVTIQAQILRLIKQLQRQMGTAVLLITHDLGVIAGMAERVLVMYLGRVVEEAPVAAIFKSPQHPYTVGLLRSVPNLQTRVRRLPQVDGLVPSPSDVPAGCPFHPRCPSATSKCQVDLPELRSTGRQSKVACWHPAASEPEVVR